MANTTGTNFTQIGYLAETVFGVPLAANVYQALRYTGESLVFNADTIKSQELRADRQVPDLIRTSTSTGGDLNVELSYGAFDDLLAGAMYDVWTAPVSDSANIDITDTSGATAPWTADLVDLGATTPFIGLSVGDWFKLGNNADPLNDQYCRVNTFTDGNTISVVGESKFETDATGAGVTVDSDGTVRIGSTRTGFAFEKGFDPGATGTSTFFHLYNGVLMSELEFSVATGSILTGRFGTIGLGMTPSGTTISTGGSPSDGDLSAAPANDIYNAIESVKSVLEGGAESVGTLEIQSLNFTLNNNVRALQSIGNITAFDSVGGTADLTGSMTVYFTNNDFVTKFTAFTSSSFSFRITDQAGNTYIIDMPRIRYSAAPVPIPGIDQDVFVNAEFTATLDGTTGNTLTITRIAA